MKTAVLFLIVVAFIAVIFGLWQLQPAAKPQTILSEKSQTAPPPEDQAFEPKDGSVLGNKTVTFKGKMLPASLIFIVSNDFQTAVKTSADGAFQKEVTLSPGLNLINVISVLGDLSKDAQKSRVLYFTPSSPGASVAAGSVKTIFDNVITINTLNGQKNVKTATATTFSFPKDATQKESSESAKDIRVGDYAIALGDTVNTDTIAAKSITIIRDNKPQNNETYVVAKILTAPKLNLFTAKTNKDSKILELTLTKTTQGLLDGKDARPPTTDAVGNVGQAKVDDIQKDKNAIIIYHTEGDKKVVDLIYLLP